MSLLWKVIFALNGLEYYPIGGGEGEPPAGDPPAGDPPKGDPPAGDPPKGDPPKGDPPPAPPTDWKAKLDPEIKDHACLVDFKDDLISVPKSLVKSYVGNQALIGVDKLPMPPKDAKPEVRDKFLNEIYTKLGRPKEAKDYKFNDVKLPEGIELKTTPEGMDALKGVAHKLGMMPHQLDGIYNWYMTDTGAKMKAYQEKLTKGRQDAETTLRTELGAAYEGKVAKSQEMLNKFAGDDYKQLLDSGFGDNPAVIRFMSKMADLISEDAFEKGGQEITMTLEEANKELIEVRKKLVGMEKSDPEYKILLKRRTDLMEMATPTKTG